MFLLYLDDSGSVKNKNESYLVLAGLSVFERQIHWLSREMEKLASSINPGHPEAVEFHASEIFSGRNPPWSGMNKNDRRDVIKSVLQIFARSHESTRAFACAIHKDSFPEIDPMEQAFEELSNRFDWQLRRKYFEHDTQRGLIIIDKSSYETSLQKLASNFRNQGTRWRDLQNLPEVPLFVDSRSSRIIQIADHIAYAVFRRYEHKDTNYGSSRESVGVL